MKIVHSLIYTVLILEFIMLLTFTADCLGSFCDFQYHPPICSPKTIKQVCFVFVTTNNMLTPHTRNYKCLGAEQRSELYDYRLDPLSTENGNNVY